jgi:hypothetical protein
VTVVIDAFDRNGREDREPQITFENRLILCAFLYGLDGIPKNVTEIEYMVRPFTVSDSRVYVVNEPVLGREKLFVFDRTGDSLPRLEQCVRDWLESILREKAKETVSLIDGNWADFERSISSLSPILKECRFAARAAGWSILAAEECRGGKLNCAGCPFAGPDNPPREIIND